MKRDYGKRIVASSPLGLVVINYELVIRYIEKAKEVACKAEFETDDNLWKEFKYNIEKGQDFLNQLILSLNFDYGISMDLKTLYLYVNRLLIKSLTSSEKRDANLDEAVKILENLLNGFKQLEEKETQEDKDSFQPDSSKLFAGLTYSSDGSLKEYIEENREYEA